MKIPFRIRSSRIAALLPLLVALSACDIYPDSGKWAGDLTVHDAFWNERYSCPVDVDITHTNDVIALNNFDLFCGTKSLHWTPGALNRRGMSLYRGDELVGDVFADGTVKIELRDPYSHDNYPRRVDKVVITWTRMGESLQFSLKEITDGQETIREGSLSRVH